MNWNMNWYMNWNIDINLHLNELCIKYSMCMCAEKDMCAIDSQLRAASTESGLVILTDYSVHSELKLSCQKSCISVGFFLGGL